MSFETLNFARRNVKRGHSLLQRALGIVKMTLKRTEQNAEIFSLKCKRGACIAMQIGFSEQTSAGIYGMDEHWDGTGYPQGLKGSDIPSFPAL